MPALRNADQDLLHKLLLGQLPSAEVERLATEYADDGRLAELAESLAGKDDALLNLLHNHETAVVDPDAERLVGTIPLERLKPALPAKPRDDTAAMKLADASTEPSSPDLTAKPHKLPERLEHYRPIKVLGQGGMGTVYLAEDTRLGREVAIKTLRPELAINPQAKERFLREARSAAKLEHDHVIPIYSVGEAADGTPFLAMPLLKGEPLDALIRRTSGPLPVASAIRLAREVASGLAAAHARGLIHRDIKPANIWLEAPNGRVKILDFGLAKLADAGGAAESDTHLTASGAIVGTPAYMAPEQASGQVVDGRADLFGLGCVLYELLAGQRAFSGPNTMSILMSLAIHTPPAPDTLNPQCPAALSRLVMQLLEKDPANRPASAEAVIQTLSELDIESVQASRAASAPGPSQDATAVRGLTPSGSPTLVESDLPRPSDSLLTMPAPAVLPVRNRAIPMQRVALALAGVLLMLLAAVVYRIQTNKGTLIVEIIDDDVKAALKTNGLEIQDTKSGRSFTIQTVGSFREASGDYKLADGHGHKLVVLDADGLVIKTNEFKLVRGEEVRVRVTAETNGVASPTSPKSLAADRRAAEWALSIGGHVGVNDQDRHSPSITEVPKEPFRLTSVNFQQNERVTDAGLAIFRDCKNLTSLHLGGTKVTDAGLAHFKDCQNLSELTLGNTAVTDAGLVHFKDCKNLAGLDVGGTKVTDVGLAHFKDCKNLAKLHLYSTQVSNAGLAHIQDCKNLTFVNLHATAVTDAGLERLAGWPKLVAVNVKNTKVTANGVKKLSAALPGCRIEWDGGVIEPTVSPDRRAAEYVLSIGGGISIKENDQERQLGAAADLPKGPFELTVVNLISNSKVSDAGLANFQDCKNLTSLDLAATKVSDAGLVHFKDCKNLTSLVLRHAPLSDAGLVHFADCKNLTILDLIDTKVSDAGLAHFKNCKNLTYLALSNTQVSDAGLAHFQDCKNLTYLDLGSTQVSDAGLAHFKDRKNLTYLVLNSTKVSDAGLAHFKDCKNLTGLHLGATQVSDAGLIHFKDCKNFTILNLGTPQVSDAGLTHFKDCKNLSRLDLSGTKVSDAGLANLAGCPKLGSLSAHNTKITETGVKKLSAALPGCKIEWDGGVIGPTDSTDSDRRVAEWLVSRKAYGIGINVPGGFVSLKASEALPAKTTTLIAANLFKDQTLTPEDFKRFTKLRLFSTLILNETNTSDAHLAQFGELPELAKVYLYQTKITDAGLKHLLNYPKLELLHLTHTPITDAATETLRSLRNLKELHLTGAKVTEAGVKKLSAALPGCKIEWDGGVIEPRSAPAPALLTAEQRRALVWLLNHKGNDASCNFDNQYHWNLKPSTLPEVPAEFMNLVLTEFELTEEAHRELVALPKFRQALGITHSPKILDAEFARILELPILRDISQVSAYNLGITDASLPLLERFRLKHLELASVSITNRGFEIVAGFPLNRLELGGCRELTGECFQTVGKIRSLTELHVKNMAVHDSDLAALASLDQLRGLTVSGTPITDAGLEHLAKMPTIKSLNLTKTKVTEAGVKKLSAALPGCKIEWDGGVIEPKPSADPDREFAEWLLSIGVGVTVSVDGGPEKGIGKLAELPAGPFRMIGFDLWGNTKVTDQTVDPLLRWLEDRNIERVSFFLNPVGDETVRRLVKLPSLKRIYLGETTITPACIPALATRTDLTALSFQGRPIGDADLEKLRGLVNLEELHLISTPATNSGLKHLRGMKKLRALQLQSTAVTGAGLDELTGCPLEQLQLNYTGVRGTDLVRLTKFPILKGVQLLGLRLEDKDLEPLIACKSLEVLDLYDNRLTDAGLDVLAKMKSLKVVTLQAHERANPVTPAGVERLRKALPNCQITYVADPDRSAAEWVLSIGGSISIKENDQEPQIGAIDDLPKGPFELMVVTLSSNKKVNDIGLANFTGCKNLTRLSLHTTPVSDAGLAHFKDCKNLTDIDLSDTDLGDASSERLADYPKLSFVKVMRTNVTKTGVQKLSAALPGCKIKWNGGVIEGSQQ